MRIDYADGAACQFGIEIVTPQSAGSWRIDIGPLSYQQAGQSKSLARRAPRAAGPPGRQKAPSGERPIAPDVVWRGRYGLR